MMTQAILNLMNAPEYRPATIRALTRLLAIPRDQRHELKRALRGLLADGLAIKLDGNRYGLKPGGGDRSATSRAARGAGGGARPSGGGIIGRLQRHARGFGFVVPEAGGRDVFLPPHAVGDLMDGDRVQVRIVREDRDGRVQGEVVRVLERSKKRVMGLYRSQGGPRGPGYVEAYDRLYEGGLLIPEGEAGEARNGMVVGVEVTRPPGEGRRATGRIVEVLGHPDDPGVDLRTVIRKYDLREEFPPDVLAEAAAIPEQVPEAEARAREDFRRLPIVTIDGETAMDFDDAVYVERRPGGAYELQVHIADVAHYVRDESTLDAEAFERGTSVYFPGTAIPMLPHKLSNGICSLNPGVDRLVQSAVMVIDRQGAVASYRFAQGVIKSAARMTYTNVARILVDRDRETMDRYRDLVPVFQLMEELCGVLNDRRRGRGSIDFDLPEPEIVLAATGEMTGIVALERNVAHRLIEEFMLAANETVAQHLFKARVPSLYRIHEKPDPRRLQEFDAVARAFGYRLPQPYTAIEPGAFQQMLDMAKGKPEERFLARLMLRSMKQARYSERRDIHFGLATTCYTHFTSPIRRYPDLVVHRVLKRVLTGPPLAERERQELEELLPDAAQRSSRMERNADAAENELVEMKKMAFMAGRLGEEFEGFVVSVHPYGFFVELREWFIDGLVRAETLRDDRYRFIETKHILKGERHGRVFRVGQPLRVRVDRVNRFLLEVEFSLADEEGPAAATGRAATRPAAPEARRGAAAPRHRAAGERAGRGRRTRRRRG